MRSSQSVDRLRSEVAGGRGPAVGSTEQIDSQLKQLVSFAFNSNASDYLLEALKKTLSRAEQRATLESRAEAQRKHEASRSPAPNFKQLARPRTPEPVQSTMPLQVDAQLDLLSFSSLVRAREGLDIADDIIKKIFSAFDADGSGTVSAHEYLMYSLSEALASTELRAIDLFKQWDEDASGTIDEKEFCRAVQVLGYAVPSKVASKLFRSLDVDRSGSLKYAELGTILNKRVGAEASKQELLRYTPGGQQANRDNRLGKPSARDSTSYETIRARTLPAEAQLDPESEISIVEQLGLLLCLHAKTIVNLLRDWDEDGNGGVDKREFRSALAALGYSAPKKDIDKLFESLDIINADGFLEYDEMNRALKKFMRPKAGSPTTRMGGMGARPTKLAKLNTTKSGGSLKSSSFASNSMSESEFAFEGIRPTTAVWQPKFPSWQRDFNARWPY